jgi:hypothetical protein
MLVSRKRVAIVSLVALASFVRSPGPVLPGERRNSVRSILERKVVYKPEGQTALEQLINVGTRFRIPMGIEWIDDPGTHAVGMSVVEGPAGSVRLKDLMTSILRSETGYKMKVVGGLLRIYKPTLAADPRNFLNMRIPEFDVSRANLLEAEQLLTFEIQAQVHPGEKYAGRGGGYGHAPGSVFAVNNITLSGRNLTVRQILDAITTANGNAIWVVHLVPSKTRPGDRYFAQDQWPTPGFHWLFIPMRGGDEAPKR